MNDWSAIKTWRKDEIARLIKSIHTASAVARPESDEFRIGHTAALVAICMAAGIDAKQIGLLSDDRVKVIDTFQAERNDWF
jgi:hypothetical protein